MLSDTITVLGNNNKITFKSNGSFCDTTVELKIIEEVEHNDLIPIEQIYNLKNIVSFTKCTSLSDKITISLEENKPMIVNYSFDLGDLRLCLTHL